MRRITLCLLLISVNTGLALGQNAITVGNAPRVNVTGHGTVPTIGSAPRLGSAIGATQTNFVPVDVTRNSVVPLTVVNPAAFRPHQPSLLERLSQLLPFATKAGSAVIAPEATIIRDTLPNVTIK